jgi:hypothetical protein
LLRPALRQTLPADQLTRLDQAFAAAAHEAFWVVLLVALATLALTLGFPRRLSPTRPR